VPLLLLETGERRDKIIMFEFSLAYSPESSSKGSFQGQNSNAVLEKKLTSAV
jgi:hypothetical protein